ncbi:TPA: MFS transporter [Salmonella enterica subsp. enterica serovar Infantis]|nr:MFS transporter [Salmonella enterica subsp. enterica serovar Infantis]
MKLSVLKTFYTGMQFSYWSVYCLAYAFAAIFFIGIGMPSKEIGIILALSNAISVFAQWGIGLIFIIKLNVKLSNCISALAVCILITLIIQKSLLSSPAHIAISYFIALSLILTLQPFVNALAFEYINANHPINFSFSRGVGSFAFAITSYFMAVLLKHSGHMVLTDALLAMSCIFIIPSLLLRGVNRPHGIKDSKIKSVNLFVKYKFLITMMLGIICLFCFHTVVTNFIAQIVFHRGGDSANVSIALMIAGASEIPVMIFLSHLLKPKNSLLLLKVSAFFFLVRALFLLFAYSIFAIQISQTVQALSFALFIPVSAFILNNHIDQHESVIAQTYLNIAMTIGGIIGCLAGGILIDYLNTTSLLIFGVISATVGFSLISRSISIVINKYHVSSE